MTDTWIDRVRAADAEAEEAYRWASLPDYESAAEQQLAALLAIAAELRAQRIARRPGAGQ